MRPGSWTGRRPGPRSAATSSSCGPTRRPSTPGSSGFLRGTANHRQASSHASTAARLDARRLHLPRMPLADQRRYGERFRELAAFEDALRTAGRLGGLLVQGMYDGLADGTVTP